jgi:Zn-dependent protease
MKPAVGQKQKFHLCGTHKTIFIDGRRFVFPVDENQKVCELTLEKINSIPPNSSDETNGWLHKSLISEPTANLIGYVFCYLITARSNIKLFSFLLVVALISYWKMATTFFLDLIIIETTSSAVMFYVCVCLILVWHEVGHAAAARKMKIRIDTMGFVIFLIFPALFTRISMVQLLKFNEKISVYLGGAIFQCYLGIGLSVAFHFSPSNFLIDLAAVNLLIMFMNLIPILKLDGYHIVGASIELLKSEKTREKARWWFNFISLVFIIALLPIIGHRIYLKILSFFKYPNWTEAIYFLFFVIDLINFILSKK